MNHCPACAQGNPCNDAVVAGFFSCDIDREAFYAQQVPLFPDKFQRWVIAIEKPSGKVEKKEIRAVVLQWLKDVGSIAGLTSGTVSNIRAVKVLSVSDVKLNTTKLRSDQRVRKVVSPIPPFHQNPFSSTERTNMLYVAIEFYYDGTAKSGNWPWSARGFIIQCPEDAFSGLIAVMRPLAAPAPPTVIDTLERPLKAAAIAIDDALSPVIKDLKEKTTGPLSDVTGAFKILMWGGAAILLFQFFQLTKNPREAFRK